MWKNYGSPAIIRMGGGGHAESEGGLWRITFEWMVEAAKGAGILIDDERIKKVLNRTSPPAEPWTEKQHSLLRKWWPAEFVPKRQWDWKTSRMKWNFGKFGYRFIPGGSQIHQSVLRRLQSDKIRYDPLNLPAAFKEHVQMAGLAPGSVALRNDGI